MNCPQCLGAGVVFNITKPGPLKSLCVFCNGLRTVELPTERKYKCPVCFGSGKDLSANKLCEVCDGWGWFNPVPQRKVQNSGVVVNVVESGQHYTTFTNLYDAFEAMTGDIQVCDPYFGQRTLRLLAGFTKAHKVQFLTSQKGGVEFKNLSSSGGLADFRKEFTNFEFREHMHGDIHDRFVINADELVLIGHGLKDVGAKDSFIVRIKKEVGQDVVNTVRMSFDAKWTLATPLS